MEKLDTTEFDAVLKDVRKSYRLIALYQQRVLDIVKYIGNTYNQHFESGHPKFSRKNSHGSSANIDRLSWDWVNLYLYEFNMGQRVIGDDRYWFKIVHQADTGYFDTSENVKIKKIAVDKYKDAESSESRLFFVLSKNEGGCPKEKLLDPYLKANVSNIPRKGNWVGVPFEMSRFINQESTDQVLKEFSDIILSEFQVEIMPKVEVLQEN